MRTTFPIRPALGLALIVATAASAGCDIALGDFSHQEAERWSKTYELPPGGRFELQNVNGRIDVRPSSGRTVEVVAEKTGRGGSPELAKEALGRVRIEDEAGPDSVRIVTRVERSSGFFNSTNVNVLYTVRVPADVEVNVRTTNGGIEVAGISARAQMSTTNGGIRARDLGGPVEARTTNGGLEIDLARVHEGGARLGCTNGGIELRLPADARASIDARITNGGIDTGGLDLATVESSRRRLEATMNGGGPLIEARCTNGGFSLSGR